MLMIPLVIILALLALLVASDSEPPDRRPNG
jgi:hypothetical protein